MRITAYAERLLEDLESLDWPDSIKQMQRNWIGKSTGAEVDFFIADSEGNKTDQKIRILYNPSRHLIRCYLYGVSARTWACCENHPPPIKKRR
ncbi:hypothetical protein [Treponema phagedenis]|uniref:hypothetical protein n=1 Tax=Treponema phagedenis TaxID=162 RepID=UPI0021CCE2B0|nr:hypothetical protein [Treponema phagedenis]